MRTLLLNSNFSPIGFINDKRAIRLIYKDKVEVISFWEGVRYYHANGFIELPAILRMKYQIQKNFYRLVFSRNAVFKRDNFSCVYCGKALDYKSITLDHIVPKKFGGKSTFENCVSSCQPCNFRKGSKYLEEVGMKLLLEPKVPTIFPVSTPRQDPWHQSWEIFLNLQKNN
jgi:HNH endonuclease